MTTRRTSWSARAAVGLMAAGLLASLGFAQSGGTGDIQGQADERDALVAAVDAYHDALHARNRDRALALLAPNVMVLESGYIETAQEYIAHHLDADMEFSAAVTGEREVLEAVIEGDVGWVISSSTSKGEFREHPVNSAGAELMVLERATGSWRIRAIHWSSRKLKD